MPRWAADQSGSGFGLTALFWEGDGEGGKGEEGAARGGVRMTSHGPHWPM